jgi:hypothetical protein
VKDEYNAEKRAKTDHPYGAYGYPGDSSYPGQQQPPQYNSQGATIGGMIIPGSGSGGGYTNNNNAGQYSFDLNQPSKLLLSESNLTVTPNANLFTNNMMYDDNSNNPNNINNTHINNNNNNMNKTIGNASYYAQNNPAKISGKDNTLFFFLFD